MTQKKKAPATRSAKARKTPLKAAKPDVRPKVGGGVAYEVVHNGGMAQNLGVRLLSVTKKVVRAEMPVEDKHLNRSGRVNGGALMAFADLLGATGTVANLPEGCRTTTLESKTNFFAAGVGPVLSGVSKPLHIGRTTMVWQTTIRNSDRKLVAIVTQTQIVLSGERR